MLTTNGVLLNAQRLERLTRAGILNFQIPFHSHIPAIHNQLSGVDCWEASLRSILMVQESSHSITPVFVATHLNLHHFANVVEIWGRAGLRRVIFNRFIPSGAGALHSGRIGVPDDKTLIQALDAAHDRASFYGVTIELGVPIDIPDDVRSRWNRIAIASCPVKAGQRRWTIGSDLTLRRCNHSAVNLGSILEDGVARLLDELSAAHGTTERETYDPSVPVSKERRPRANPRVLAPKS